MQRVGGIYFFGAYPIWVRFFISMHYPTNQLMDFDQACIDTLLGGGEELMSKNMVSVRYLLN